MKNKQFTVQEIVDSPSDAYNHGVGVGTIREALEMADYSDDEVTEIIDSLYE